jgi:uncharacterized repeat protein (TIGR01451 family)
VGNTLTYTVTVRNAGPKPATGVNVRFVLPAGALVESTSRPCTPNDSGMQCRLGSIRKRAKAVLTVDAKATTTGTLSASARVSAKTRDPRRQNNTSAQTTKVAGMDTVTGHGVRPAFQAPTVSVTIDVEAASAFNGENASGTFATRYFRGDPDLRGRVVCLTVAGKRAMVGGVVESSNSAVTPVGSGVLFAITDNGDPGVGRDTEVSYLGVEDPNSCPLPEVSQEIALSDGNFAVHDEQP